MAPSGTPDIPPTPTEPVAGYFVDSKLGNDSNSGLSPSDAWERLAPVNDHEFEPGESVHFASGSSWDTDLVI